MVLSFTPGHLLNTPVCANITIVDDDILENTEAFSIVLLTEFPEGVFLSRNRSTVEIADNEEGKYSLRKFNAELNEQNSILSFILLTSIP